MDFKNCVLAFCVACTWLMSTRSIYWKHSSISLLNPLESKNIASLMVIRQWCTYHACLFHVHTPQRHNLVAFLFSGWWLLESATSDCDTFTYCNTMQNIWGTLHIPPRSRNVWYNQNLYKAYPLDWTICFKFSSQLGFTSIIILFNKWNF